VPRGARSDTRADVLVAAACTLASLILLVLPDAPRDRAAGMIRGTVVAPLAAMQQRAALARRAFGANDSLVRIADSVVRRSQRLDELEAENARLRGLLGLGHALGWGFVPAEALVGRGMGDDHTLLLSAGRAQGVERLAGVVSADGLVGMIQHVDAATSVAITWPHPDFRVSAVSADGSAFGIVSRHAAPGAEGFLLELRGVPFRSRLANGTMVVSSGLGGVYPRGIPIGTVLAELKSDAGGWERTYVLKPAVRPADVTSVLIVSAARAEAGVDGVWPAAAPPKPSPDSLARRAAADSARRAAADSARRAARRPAPADSAAPAGGRP